jgi:hypothetical protein
VQPPPAPKVELSIEPPPAPNPEPVPPATDVAETSPTVEPAAEVVSDEELLAEPVEDVEVNGSLSEAADSVLRQFQLAVEAAKKGNAATQPAGPRVSRRQQLAEQMKEVGERPFVQKALELFDVPAGQFRYAPPDDGVQ